MAVSMIIDHHENGIPHSAIGTPEKQINQGEASQIDVGWCMG